MKTFRSNIYPYSNYVKIEYYFEPDPALIKIIEDTIPPYFEAYIGNQLDEDGFVQICDGEGSVFLTIPKDISKKQLVWFIKQKDKIYAEGLAHGIERGKIEKQNEIKKVLGLTNLMKYSD